MASVLYRIRTSGNLKGSTGQRVRLYSIKCEINILTVHCTTNCVEWLLYNVLESKTSPVED